jgi:chemotaxis protein MotB
MRLLIADNDPALATFLHESFGHEHYAVDLTRDGEDAKHWVEERNYDLVILDLNHVRVEGTQVLQFVRTKRRQLPILVLCSRNRSEERVQILDMGADDLVLKPFSFSELIDRRKAGQLAMAIQVAFQQMGAFYASDSKIALANSVSMPLADVQIIADVKRLETVSQLPNAAQTMAAGTVDRPKMDELQMKLQDALALQIDNRIISVRSGKEGIVVSLREAGFFQSGSIQLGPQTIPALAAIVKIVGPEKTDIRIEGHTDNVPIHNGKYDSNWELSTARATEIIKLFITKFSLAPNRLSASSYDEYYPTASNDSAEGRATNRRVDLVILNSISDAGVPTPIVVAPFTVSVATDQP